MAATRWYGLSTNTCYYLGTAPPPTSPIHPLRPRLFTNPVRRARFYRGKEYKFLALPN